MGTWLNHAESAEDEPPSESTLPTLKVFRQPHLAPLKKLPLVAKRGPLWPTVERVLHRCALTGDIASDVTVTEDNRYEMRDILLG